jgi:inosose dehydratase
MKIGCHIGQWKSGGTFEGIVKSVGESGIEGIEVFKHHVEPFYDKPDMVKNLLSTSNVELSGAYFGDDGFISHEKEREVLGEAAALSEFLGKVGSRFIVMNGGVSRKLKPNGFTEDDFKQLARTMNGIGRAAKDHGVSAVIHPHLGMTVVSPKDLDRLLEYLDTALVGLCFHAGHQWLENYDPYEMYEAHSDLLRYCHIGDSSEGDEGALLGEGVLDQKRLMKPIVAAGYDGWMVIESAKNGVPQEEYIAHAIRYIREELIV